MLFTTVNFFIFFGVIYICYLLVSHNTQNLLLVFASYFFYGFWDYRFLVLILASTIVDYFVGIYLAKQQAKRKKKLLLLLSIAFNLGVLGFFKYYNFFVGSFVDAFNVSESSIFALKIILPVGISFYTFQTLSYSIDIYRGKIKPVTKFTDFSLFVCFFPQLVAGPIERASVLLPQLRSRRVINSEDIQYGVFYILWGLFLKLFVADSAALISDYTFRNYDHIHSVNIALGSVAFAFQIYGDFAGYSYIARGLARLMGIKLSPNFNLPYIASSVSDFWRRWHITLSTWFRDYVYIPLGGNQGGRLVTFRNLVITMALAGLWHGASWTYIVWGIYHGLLLVGYQIWVEAESFVSNRYNVKVPKVTKRWTGMFLTFSLVCIGWIIFRAENIDKALLMIGGMLTGNDVNFSIYLTYIYVRGLMYCLLPLFVFEVIQIKYKSLDPIISWSPAMRGFAFYVLILLVGVTITRESQPFIYFQF